MKTKVVSVGDESVMVENDDGETFHVRSPGAGLLKRGDEVRIDSNARPGGQARVLEYKGVPVKPGDWIQRKGFWKGR